MNKKKGIESNISRLRKVVYVCGFDHSKKKYNNCYLIEGSIIICFYRTGTMKKKKQYYLKLLNSNWNKTEVKWFHY